MKMKTIVSESMVAAMFFLPMAFAATNEDIREEMTEITEDYNELGRQIEDPAMNARSRELIDDMISSAREASSETPARAKQLKGHAQMRLADRYKAEMNTFIAKLEDMKMLLESQDNKGAKEIYTELKRWTKPEHSAPYK